jgi:hypothetical protein
MCMTPEDYTIVQQMQQEVSEIAQLMNQYMKEVSGKEPKREQARQRIDHIVSGSSYLNQNLQKLAIKHKWSSNNPFTLWTEFKKLWKEVEHFKTWEHSYTMLNELSLRIHAIKPPGPDTPRSTTRTMMLQSVQKSVSHLVTWLKDWHNLDAKGQQYFKASIQSTIDDELGALFPKFFKAFQSEPNAMQLQHEWQQFINTWSGGNGDISQCYTLIQSINSGVHLIQA